jgi:hypothetical protein
MAVVRVTLSLFLLIARFSSRLNAAAALTAFNDNAALGCEEKPRGEQLKGGR